MEPREKQQIDALVHSALALPPAKQQAFLRQSCAGDSVLFEAAVSRLASLGHTVTSQQQISPNPSDADTQAADHQTMPGPYSTMVGKTVSHYRVLGRLGSGGMGVVYQAEDVKLGRRVAVKFLPGDLATDPVAFERLQREARAASALEHSNICPIYELGEHEGQPFIAMQFLEGQTLREWVEKGSKQNRRSRPEPALDFAIQIANGLEVAHQKGIIHRDIKPANIFITARGEAKILDFGLAKVVEDQSASKALGDTTVTQSPTTPGDSSSLNLTRTGTMVGTAYYMSPEQIRGDKLDPRTDLFSLGLVLYEMVTGRRAFAGATAQHVYEAILTRDPLPVRQLNADTPPELVRIIDKAIEKDRDQRYSSAKELTTDLVNLREELRRPADLWNRWRWVAAGAALLLLAALISVFLTRRTSPTTLGTAATAKARRSVAVLGFRNLSNRSEEDWISTALAEMVGMELAAGQQLRVIPGENVAHMKLDLSLPGAGGYGSETLSKIRRNLGTDVIVQGSYLLSGENRLRIDLQMQDANAGETLAAVSENGSESEITELVSRAGASLREQLGIPAATASDIEQSRATLPTNPQAARLYAEGLAKLRMFDALAARDLLERAIVVEPNHAMSHSLLGESLFALGYDQQAQIEAKNAFELSHSLPRDNQLLIEGRYRELSNDYAAAIEVYKTLWNFFPDDLDYGLRLASTQTKGALAKDALATIAKLRESPEPSRNDPRIDLAEANASESLSDFKRAQQVSSAAAQKAHSLGSRLMLAEARGDECWAWNRLGDLDKAFAACSEAHDLAQSSGNLRAAATALNGMANALYDKGDLEGARREYEAGLQLARRIGAQQSIAVLVTNLGNVYHDQGKLVDAQHSYEEGLSIDRQTGNKRGIASALGSLANVRQGIGDLPGATRMQEDALQAFRDVGDRRGEASTLNNLGYVLADRGQLAAAKSKFEEAMKVQQQIGYRRGRGFSLNGMAEVLLMQDKLPEARSAINEAIAQRKELQDDSALATSQTTLAEIALAESKPTEAETLLRSSIAQFEKQKVFDDDCWSSAILARALLAQNRFNEAQTASDSAQSLCQRGQDRTARFQATLATALVRSKTSGTMSESLRLLDALREEAGRTDYIGYELQSRLFRGEIEMISGKTADGHATLQSLQRDAQNKGFALFARQTGAALQGNFSF